MKLQQIALSLTSIACVLIVGCGGNSHNAKPTGELSQKLTSQESLQIQRENVQRVTQRTRAAIPEQPSPSRSLPVNAVEEGSGSISIDDENDCTNSGSAPSTGPSGDADGGEVVSASGINENNEGVIHPQETTRYLVNSQTPQQLSISFTQNHFSIRIEEEIVLEGSWREINSHTLEISFDGYTLHVDVALDGNQLDFEEIPSAGPAMPSCLYESSSAGYSRPLADGAEGGVDSGYLNE